MQEFPKIETLYNRDEHTHKVIPSQLRLREFGHIKEWVISEKIDGTNVRIGYHDHTIELGGRTDQAQMPMVLVEYLRQTFTDERMGKVFDDESSVTLFGEGYGEKIQSGGRYRSGVSFRLFDVLVGSWWLERDTIIDIAAQLSILVVPSFGSIDRLPQSVDDLKDMIGHDGRSMVAHQDNGPGVQAEGIVARTVPLLKTRGGERLIWKLKFRDF